MTCWLWFVFANWSLSIRQTKCLLLGTEMNKVYRSVWNESTGTWVAAQENATGRKKQKRTAVGVSRVFISITAAGVALVPLAANANGVVTCSSDGSTYGTSGDGSTPYDMHCGAGSDVVYIGGAPAGTPANNAYADPTVTYISVNNATSASSDRTGSTPSQSIKLHSPTSIVLDGTTDLNSHKIINLTAGVVSSISTDGVNGSQLFGVSNSMANALGAGSSVNANGTISAPSFALTNANAIDGTTGAATNIGSAFSTVDTALGKLNTSITNINNGQGTRYFKAAGNNDGTDDAKSGSYGSIAIGPNALTAIPGTTTTDAIAIGHNATANYASNIALGAAATAGGGDDRHRLRCNDGLDKRSE
ncbi:ESPR-type extended signal peptide-containing protein [Paraburkholderia dipogonis]|uniref:ESPR-type extended signal peptide-containing protein n=1 Tax=Paraburkholderia dipogonis TaxID=1211383 RepID=UPI00361F0E50